MLDPIFLTEYNALILNFDNYPVDLPTIMINILMVVWKTADANTI